MGVMTFRPGQRLIIPGVQVYSPRPSAGGATGLVLDGISNVAAAYSLRQLRTAYAGSAVRVRRSSDSTEQDIGFVAGEFDSSAFTTFVGGGTGFVKTWYDQSGNSRNAAQATTANQPSIVLSVVNSKPVVRFDGTNDSLDTASVVFTPVTGIAVANHSGTTFNNFNGLITIGDLNINDYILVVGFNATANLYFVDTSVYVSGVLTAVFSPLTTYKIVSAIAATKTTADIRIGRDRGNGRYWNGDIAEVVMLAASISAANHNTIGSDMATRFGLSWSTVT